MNLMSSVELFNISAPLTVASRRSLCCC